MPIGLNVLAGLLHKAYCNVAHVIRPSQREKDLLMAYLNGKRASDYARAYARGFHDAQGMF